MRPLRILTWPTHGDYLHSLGYLPHTFHVITNAARSVHHKQERLQWDWQPNIHAITADAVRSAQFDCILFQHTAHYLEDQYLYLSEAQRRLPRIFIEHGAPFAHPCDSRHPLDDPNVLLVHRSPFNQLMWDSGRQSTVVIEPGVAIPSEVRYGGERDSGLVIANRLHVRGRAAGADIFEQLARELPLQLIGCDAQDHGGTATMSRAQLRILAAEFRFLFNPMRYSSLRLPVIEAMMIGMPVIGLATAEMASVIQNGISGYVDTDVGRLAVHMRELLRDPHYAFALGRGAQRRASERFGIHRFMAEWNAVLQQVTDVRTLAPRELASVA